MSSSQVAQLLHDEGLIRDPLVFRIYVRREGLAARLRAGEYRLSGAMSVPEIAADLVRGAVVTHTVTVPEGLTVERTIAVLGATEFFAGAALRRAVDEAAAAWPHLPEQARTLAEPLEGYLFPDTYSVTRETEAVDLVRRMLGRFDEVFDEAWLQRAAELEMSVHEVVTLASLVEREARLPEERPLVAAVFHNRLRIGMKLDADPTVRYALDVWDEPLTYEDLRVDSPHNTYLYGGLPPGPIAAPGRAALEATLYPADVDYRYFVSKFDGTGAHAFANNYDQHRQNIRQYRDN